MHRIRNRIHRAERICRALSTSGYSIWIFDSNQTEWFSYEVVEGFPVGIGETEFDYSKAVRIFPNPLLTEALVDFESLGAVVSQIRLLTVNGAVIKTFSNNSSARVNLNLREESAGIYILKLTTLDGKKYYKKVIKK